MKGLSKGRYDETFAGEDADMSTVGEKNINIHFTPHKFLQMRTLITHAIQTILSQLLPDKTVIIL